MNYTDITALALSYADRTDNEVTNRMSDFTKVVEDRINTMLRVGDMSVRAKLTMTEDKYYTLPSDFGGLRDIQVYGSDSSGGGRTASYVNPEQMNAIEGSDANINELFYTIIAQQLQLSGSTTDDVIEIVYYQKLPPLETNTTNWLSVANPNAYVFGLLVEISVFTKDLTAKTEWDARFKETLTLIQNRDDIDRWSGTPLQIKVG